MISMVNQRRKRTQARIDRRLREGRGKGEGSDYKPYLSIRDVPSIGRSHRDIDLSGGRTTHYLSDLEYRFAAIACWLLPVRDLREQYPLPLEETRAIATACGYPHTRDPRTKEDDVATTDILLTLETPDGSRDLACSIKHSQELGGARTLEKLEIERRWWTRRGVPWVLVTEQEISQPLADNILNLRHYYRVDDRLSLTDEILAVLIDELSHIIARQDMPLSHAAFDCDERLGQPPGTSLTIAYHLLATRRWHTDLRQLLDPSRPLKLLPSPVPTPFTPTAPAPNIPRIEDDTSPSECATRAG